MKIYADYQFYENEYIAAESPVFKKESDFLPFSCKATQYIDLYTFGNLPDKVPDILKMCCCEIAETLFISDNSNKEFGIKSETVGDYRIEYENISDKEKIINSKIKIIVYRWLAGTGLLYCGVE